MRSVLFAADRVALGYQFSGAMAQRFAVPARSIDTTTTTFVGDVFDLEDAPAAFANVESARGLKTVIRPR